MPTVATLNDETQRRMPLKPGPARAPRARFESIFVRTSKNAIIIPTAIIKQPITTVTKPMGLMDVLLIQHHDETRGGRLPSDCHAISVQFIMKRIGTVSSIPAISDGGAGKGCTRLTSSSVA